MGVLRFDSKKAVLLLATGFFIFLAFALSSGLKKNALSPSYQGFDKETDIQIKDLSFSRTNEGKTDWVVKALHADLSEKGEKALLKQVSFAIPYGNGYQLKLEGDEGLVYPDGQDFSVWKKKGLMSVDLDHGYTLQTSRLEWDKEQRLIISQGDAHLSGEHLELDGSRIEISVDHQEMAFFGNVRALLD